MASLTIHDGNTVRSVTFTPPERLLDLLRGSGVPVNAPCGGMARCNQCKVSVTGALSEPDAAETALIPPGGGIRFACRAAALGDVDVFTNSMAARSVSIQIDGATPPFTVSNGLSGVGAAVDIGTTTIAAYLYAMDDGGRLGAASALNPQGAFGADVISRVQASMDGHADALATLVCGCITQLVESLLARHSLNHNDLTRIVLTGNTAMLTLLCALPTKPLSAMPFRAEHLFGEFRRPDALRLPVSAQVYLPRCVGAYVGADITTAMLAGGLITDGRVHRGKPLMLADIGTNGEIALAAGGALSCCATAAGPAFEGAGISCGMLAEPGAIDRVDWLDGRFQYSTIGGEPARGICGTGLVDTVAAMLDAGMLDESGYLDGGDFTFPGTSVAVTQKDARALQLAKAAIRAGMLTLLSETGLAVGDVDALVVAGGFGSKIRVSSAERIGLLPGGFAAKARAIGNGAGMGAAMALLNDGIRVQSEGVVGAARVVELSTNPVFMDEYVEGMMFEP
ncbi:MAG: ASKHA domain-containing protein [Oscillospiraceae bacterium]|jgi:uncharacterized 2Fe-2S/4Fe-4S cluster protein (DUF4445 family)|nr:ASKHA domain-containing protein [Oscillospiraceae bacterium]